MTKAELLKLAGQYFIADTGLSTANLIRKIQIAEGHADCYATGKTRCSEMQCRWRGDCLGEASPPDPADATPEPSRTQPADRTSVPAASPSAAPGDSGLQPDGIIQEESTMDSEALTTRIEIKGELAIFTAEAIRQQLLDAFEHGGDVEVDLCAVCEIDSAGVQLLVSAKREAARLARTLRFYGHSRPVFDLLELYDLSGHLGDPLLIRSETL